MQAAVKSIPKKHYCSHCKKKSKARIETFRLYIRTKVNNLKFVNGKPEIILVNGEPTPIPIKRHFEPIGWYCQKCKLFEKD